METIRIRGSPGNNPTGLFIADDICCSRCAAIYNIYGAAGDLADEGAHVADVASSFRETLKNMLDMDSTARPTSCGRCGELTIIQTAAQGNTLCDQRSLCLLADELDKLLAKNKGSTKGDMVAPWIVPSDIKDARTYTAGQNALIATMTKGGGAGGCKLPIAEIINDSRPMIATAMAAGPLPSAAAFFSGAHSLG